MLFASPPTIAIVGATGAVGRELLAVLGQRRFPHADVRLIASDRSTGLVLDYRDTTIPLQPLRDDVLAGVDLVFLCVGGDLSRHLAPRAVAGGAVVVDQSSAFRGEAGVPLVIPEINGHALDTVTGPGIIANPNCSTIIALMAVTPLHRAAGVRRMVVSTYQAVSGAGAPAMRELETQARQFADGSALTTEVFGRQTIFNIFSHDSPIGPDGYNEEESKLLHETHRIWDDDSVAVTATCVRVPVLRAHCESINLTFRTPLTETEARRHLAAAPGVRIVDDRPANHFPEPLDATGRDEVLVGRIRGDRSQPPGMGLELFVAGDQLRKGAALNAVQIAERLVRERKEVETVIVEPKGRASGLRLES